MKPVLPDTCLHALESGEANESLMEFYGPSRMEQSRKRFTNLLRSFTAAFGDIPLRVMTAPGRTELGGNHTDHNHGRVLAAAIHRDCAAAVAPSGDMAATVLSEGFAPITIDLSDTEPKPCEHGTAAALIRGTADSLKRAGYALRGFRACVSSTIPAGTGLSSSAAFSVLTGRIINHLFNAGRIPVLNIARAAREAENRHFGKPCGFMDQIACSFMGASAVDFMDPDNPTITPLECGFRRNNIRLAVVDTGGSHEDLTPDYAAICAEMQAASEVLGRRTARGLSVRQVMDAAGRIRAAAGDRAVLRLLHFIEEDERVAEQTRALETGDMPAFIRMAGESGDSSCLLLQNCFSPARPEEQPIPLALAAARRFLGNRGACRVHGGGFAGTIQAYVPEDLFEGWRTYMETLFGTGAVIPLRIRRPGTIFPIPTAAEER